MKAKIYIGIIQVLMLTGLKANAQPDHAGGIRNDDDILVVNNYYDYNDSCYSSRINRSGKESFSPASHSNSSGNTRSSLGSSSPGRSVSSDSWRSSSSKKSESGNSSSESSSLSDKSTRRR